MSGFLDRHSIISSADLTGPRVHSSDLMPVLFDGTERALEITAKSMKAKILSKGLIMVNISLMMTPMGLRLLERNGDAYSGAGVLPLYREDKAELLDQMVVPMESFAAAAIDAARLDAYVEQLESAIDTVMPWNVGETPVQLNEILASGIERADSPIARELMAFEPAIDVEALKAGIRQLNFANSKAVPEFVAQLPEALRAPMTRYANACYHCIGGNTVGAECGTSLSTLGEFNSPKVLLAARDASPQQLANVSTFTRALWGYAMSVAQTMAIDSASVEKLSFEDCARLSAPLRDPAYRESYRAFLAPYIALTERGSGEDDLDFVDEGEIVALTEKVARPLRAYASDVFGTSPEDGGSYATISDVALDSIGVSSGIGTVYAPLFGLAARPGEATGRLEAAGALADGVSGKLLAAIDRLPVDEPRKRSLRTALGALHELETLA